MKSLKCYNELLNNEKLYKKISFEDSVNMNNKYDQIKFTDNEIQLIKNNILNNYFNKVKYQDMIVYICDNRGYSIMSIRKYYDEWYKICYRDKIFKCDTIKGVINVLNDTLNVLVKESKLEDNQYKLSTRNDTLNKLGALQKENLTTKQIEVIHKLLPGPKFNIHINDYVLNIYLRRDNRYDHHISRILKLSDEWFITIVYHDERTDDYICDGFDGLYNCVTDKILSFFNNIK